MTTYKMDNACGTITSNPDYENFTCAEVDVEKLEIEDMHKLIDEYKDRKARASNCMEQRHIFRNSCRHPSTQDQTHADDDAHVQGIEKNCDEILQRLAVHCAKEWERNIQLTEEHNRETEEHSREAAAAAARAEATGAMADQVGVVFQRLDALGLADTTEKFAELAAKVKTKGAKGKKKGKAKGEADRKEKGKGPATEAKDNETLAEAITRARAEKWQMRVEAIERAKAARHKASVTFTDSTWRTCTILQLRRLHRVLGLPPPQYEDDMWTYMLNSTALSLDDLQGFAIALEKVNRESMMSLLQEARNQ
jgi:hypothetical protein